MPRSRRRSSRSVALGLIAAIAAVTLSAAPAAPASSLEPAAAVGPRATAAVPVPRPAADRGLPPQRRWLRQVRTALHGSRARLHRIAARSDRPLAVNLDIDNTALATAYDRGTAVRPVLRLARAAARHDVAVLFATGRREDRLISVAAALAAAGYPVDALCGRQVGEPLVDGKVRCRAGFAAAGWRIVANVGNRDTDFAGDGYGRAYRLPDYRGRLQ